MIYLWRQDVYKIYSVMEEFIWTLKNEKSNKMENAIQGRGIFWRFKDMIYQIGISQQWYGFQAEYYRKLAIEWCKEHNLEYIERET